MACPELVAFFDSYFSHAAPWRLSLLFESVNQMKCTGSKFDERAHWGCLICLSLVLVASAKLVIRNGPSLVWTDGDAVCPFILDVSGGHLLLSRVATHSLYLLIVFTFGWIISFMSSTEIFQSTSSQSSRSYVCYCRQPLTFCIFYRCLPWSYHELWLGRCCII